MKLVYVNELVLILGLIGIPDVIVNTCLILIHALAINRLLVKVVEDNIYIAKFLRA